MPNNFAQLVKEIEALKKEASSKFKTYLAEELQRAFAIDESVKSFTWVQFTPYFNDGDPCSFSLHDEIVVNIHQYEGYYYDGVDEMYALGNTHPHNRAADIAGNIIGSIPDEYFKDAFDDHVQVTAHRDGSFTTEDYDHD